jgi:hypothetical protein
LQDTKETRRFREKGITRRKAARIVGYARPAKLVIPAKAGIQGAC